VQGQGQAVMDSDERRSEPLLQLLRERLTDEAAGLGLDRDAANNLMTACLPVARWLNEKIGALDRPFLLGVNGAQGSGKTTFVKLLGLVMHDGFDRHTTHLGIDDFYKTRQDRQALARVHPMLSTRGVPGTHDMELALSVVNSLLAGETVRSPRFDKAIDDRLPECDWIDHAGATDVILFEGWCVGAVSQMDSELQSPLNSLEREQDGDRIWRTYVNDRLQKSAYREMFDRLDGLLMLKVPGMEAVSRWRWQQEEQLRLLRGPLQGIMTRKQVGEFIMHYERLTRHMLHEMPQRADLVITVNAQHKFVEMMLNNPESTAKYNPLNS
jgi:D-glycerate 3-kinase